MSTEHCSLFAFQRYEGEFKKSVTIVQILIESATEKVQKETLKEYRGSQRGRRMNVNKVS